MNGAEDCTGNALRFRCGSHVALLCFPGGLASGADFLGRMMKAGIDVGRLDFDDLNTGAGEFESQRGRAGAERGLGGIVGRHERYRQDRGQRGDVDDAARPLRAHRR